MSRRASLSILVALLPVVACGSPSAPAQSIGSGGGASSGAGGSPVDAGMAGMTGSGGALAMDGGDASVLAQPQLFGANVHAYYGSVTEGQMAQEFTMLKATGAKVGRVGVWWSTIEWTAKGEYIQANLDQLDTLMSQASTDGISIIVCLADTPPWASAGGAWNDAPTNPADMGDFALYLADHYGSQIAAIEVWNEPEIDPNGVPNLIPPANLTLAMAYTGMVQAIYTSVKPTHPDIQVLAGALSYADVTFLGELYDAGMKGSYDGISLHPYADGADPANLMVTHSFLGGIEAMHAAQVANGDDTPEWVTEFGWPVGTSPGANTEQEQATYIESAIGLVRGLPYVRAATVYQFRDLESDPTNPEDNFGLVEEDFTPRPALAAFTSAM
jgi:polysaccharide biosynthesis protein PslG